MQLGDEVRVGGDGADRGNAVFLAGGGDADDVGAGAGALGEAGKVAGAGAGAGHGDGFVDAKEIQDSDANVAKPGGGRAASAEDDVRVFAGEDCHQEAIGEDEG